MAQKIPQTFRCHITVKGEQCPCDMTMVNTFTFSLDTINRKVDRVGSTVDTKAIAEHAICPWHAAFLKRLRMDITRIDEVLSLFESRQRQIRRAKAAREEVARRNEYLNQRFIAHQPALGAALINAGVRT